MIELLVATGNAGKAKEFREMLGDDRIRWCDLAALSASGGQPPHVEETGRTFRANACIKATAYATYYHRWTLADDSGLEIDALNGAPGVLSARWAETHSAGRGDLDNNRLVLRQLNAVPDDRRTARFVCVLALSDPTGRIILTTRGEMPGRVLREPRGQNGFGYDPLFLIDELDKTTAELPPDQKHAISHRGRALREMKTLLARTRLAD